MTTGGPLTDRNIVVTGGSMGIGLACAEAVVRAGGRVTLAARGSESLEQARARLDAAAPGRVTALRCDVSAADDVAALFDLAAAHFGDVHGVVHAAAVIGPIGPAVDADPAEWLDTVRTDLFGAFLVARAAARAMIPRRYGKIVLLSGGGGTAPFPNYSAYACSKAGVVRLAETLAIELAGADIDVNALAPGFVATRMQEATLAAGDRAGADYVQRTRERLRAGSVSATPAADAAVFLLGAESDGIRGRLLAVPWDDWGRWPERAREIDGSDLFTLRRIVPADRGLAW